MADKKISQLTAVSTPLAGTEVLPIVQSSATKQVSVADLTAGRSINAADATLTTGNLIIGTSGKGIDFSATGQAGGMTSELLNDYEEGTFTPTISQGFNTPVSLTTNTGTYVKIGTVVYFSLYIYLDSGQVRNGDAIGIAGFPFAAVSGLQFAALWNYASGVVSAGVPLPVLNGAGSNVLFYNTAGSPFVGTSLTSARPEIAISGIYKTA